MGWMNGAHVGILSWADTIYSVYNCPWANDVNRAKYRVYVTVVTEILQVSVVLLLHGGKTGGNKPGKTFMKLLNI